MTKNFIGALITFKAKPGKKHLLIDHLNTTSNSTAEKENGTLLFLVSTSPIDPDTVSIFELYENTEAQSRHEGTEEYGAAKEKTRQLTDGPPQVVPLVIAGGKGPR